MSASIESALLASTLWIFEQGRQYLTSMVIYIFVVTIESLTLVVSITSAGID